MNSCDRSGWRNAFQTLSIGCARTDSMCSVHLLPSFSIDSEAISLAFAYFAAIC